MVPPAPAPPQSEQTMSSITPQSWARPHMAIVPWARGGRMQYAQGEAIPLAPDPPPPFPQGKLGRAWPAKAKEPSRYGPQQHKHGGRCREPSACYPAWAPPLQGGQRDLLQGLESCCCKRKHRLTPVGVQHLPPCGGKIWAQEKFTALVPSTAPAPANRGQGKLWLCS